jgi:prepilin-type N-terminal cleavage/methylation domain-containing protein
MRHAGTEDGFTLIEAMVAMVVISVSLLAMGAFTLAVMRSDNTAQQRTVGMHVAEQALEQWYSDNVMPSATTTVSVNHTTYQFESFDTPPVSGVSSANLSGAGPAADVRAITVYWKNSSGVHQVTVTNMQRMQ